MSEKIQLEHLLDEKANMEDEGRQLDEEQKQLNDRAKVLTERIIEELRKKNNAKQDSVNSLQSKVNDLESQLNALSNTKPAEVTEETSEPATLPEKMRIPFDPEPIKVPENDNVTVAEVAQEEDVSTETKEKKRRFF